MFRIICRKKRLDKIRTENGTEIGTVKKKRNERKKRWRGRGGMGRGGKG